MLRILLAFLILANLLKHSLRSLWSKPLSVYNSKLLTQPMIHNHPLRGMLSTLLALKKPVTFVTGFVIRIGFEPMALILEG
jgi:hypothetical protein